ncbi:hypothetical protein HHI36_011101 [Cryptolaemus montrouzieri]|uniref:Phospholipase A2-like central domain-containing protein n=1 Tax=Cryptolaemus montrouzieri TaxID=559131 RepID=A0ABD2MLK8_9CUCU
MIRLFLVCVCAYELTNANGILSETSDYDDVQHDNRFSGLPSKSSLAQRKAESLHRNEQIYIGFVNNPFGPSKLHEKNPRMNISTSQSKVSPIKAAHEKNTTISKFNNGTQEERPKRGVIDLFNMVSCATGCNPWIYNGYGCYCGLLGSGVPVDGIDRCCKWHDQCYNNARCPMFLEYFMPYYWTCFHHRPLCGVSVRGYGGRKSCAHELCECDRRLSECLRRFSCPTARARSNGIPQTSNNDDIQVSNKFSVSPSRSSFTKRKIDTRQQMYNGFANEIFGPSKSRQKDLRIDILASSQNRTNIMRAADEKNRTNQKLNDVTQERRSKRSVWNLFHMINCATGCDPLSYNGYGCFCGLLGEGIPVDGIDSEAKKDQEKKGGIVIDSCRILKVLTYIQTINACSSNSPTGKSKAQRFEDRDYHLTVDSRGLLDTCARELCICDRQLAECFKRYPCPTTTAPCTTSTLRSYLRCFGF